VLKQILLIPILSSFLLADFIGAELHVGAWMVNPSGSLKTPINEISLENDLGLYLNKSLQGEIKFEHPVPLIPNLMISHTRIKHEASENISQDIDILGRTFNIQDNVNSSISLSMTDATIYYEILDNWLSADIGLTARKIDGELTLNSSIENYKNDLSIVLPMLYGSASLEIPTTDLKFTASLNYFSYDDNVVYDMKCGARVNWTLIGVEAGYRKFKINSEMNDLKLVTSFQGFYTNFVLDFWE